MASETAVRQHRRPARARRKELIGVVTSAKMQKTIVVQRDAADAAQAVRPLSCGCRRNFTRMTKQGEARPGDTVRIVETRPLSKLKRWRLAEVVSRSTSVRLARSESKDNCQ